MAEPTFETTRRIGGDLPVSRLGYGAMRLSGQPGNWGPCPDPEGAGQVLRRALEIGVNLIDTAYAYGAGLNETLIAQSLRPYPEGLFIATKCGQTKMGPGIAYRDGRRKAIRTGCEASLKHLRVERLDLLQLHWIDEDTPIEESVAALAELMKEGKVRHIGVSNVTLDELKRARGVAPIASVQNRFSFAHRTHPEVVRYCESEDITFFPYGPLDGNPAAIGAPLADPHGVLAAEAAKRSCTPSQMALAWLLALSPVIVPIPGTRSIAHLAENVGALRVPLTPAEAASL
jgi:aryl-alcohol dehydrogenase-like predicted oxidoreductase